MQKNNSKQAGRPRHNDTGSPVILDRAKLRRLKDVVNELLEEYEFTTHTLAKYTIGERRSSYISGIARGEHIAKPPVLRPREDEYDSIMRFRAFVSQQDGASGELTNLFMEWFACTGQLNVINNRIYKTLRRLNMKVSQ